MRATSWILAAMLFAPSALADTKVDKKACSDSYEKAQVLQKANKFTDARAEVVVCMQDACPKWIQTECGKWLADIDEHQPTLVVAARDAEGHDILDASIEIDGAMVSSKVDGSPVRVDPGPHTVRVIQDGQVTEQKVVTRWGDKNRALQFTLKGATHDTTSTAPAAKRGSMVPSIVVGSLGVVALGVSIGVGLAAKSDVDAMRSAGGCAPHCAQGDIDSANTKLIVSDILTGVGVAGIATSVLLFIFRPTVKENTAFVISPALSGRGGGASLGVRF